MIMNEIEELTMLLLYLTAWNEEGYFYDKNDNLNKGTIKRSWKGYSFDALNNLTNKGYLYYSKNKSKSVSITKELAKHLIEKYLKSENQQRVHI